MPFVLYTHSYDNHRDALTQSHMLLLANSQRLQFSPAHTEYNFPGAKEDNSKEPDALPGRTASSLSLIIGQDATCVES